MSSGARSSRITKSAPAPTGGSCWTMLGGSAAAIGVVPPVFHPLRPPRRWPRAVVLRWRRLRCRPVALRRIAVVARRRDVVGRQVAVLAAWLDVIELIAGPRAAVGAGGHGLALGIPVVAHRRRDPLAGAVA